MGLVDNSTLDRINELALKADLHKAHFRSTLLGGIEADVVGLMENIPVERAQLDSDLRFCNEHQDRNGRFLLVRWLENAARTAEKLIQGPEFERLKRLARRRSRPRVFISFARTYRKSAAQIRDALRAHCDVFIDLDLPINETWPGRIDKEIAEADLFLLLLSRDRDMMLAEVEEAWRRNRDSQAPSLMVVRMVDSSPLKSPLDGYLAGLVEHHWESEHDTERTVRDAVAAARGDAPEKVPEAPTHRRAAPMAHHFLRRAIDDRAERDVAMRGFTMVIKGPRQCGKSHLLDLVEHAARRAGKTVARIDFQQLDSEALKGGDALFHQFCGMVTSRLRIECPLDRHYRGASTIERCGAFFEDFLLNAVTGQLCLLVDAADRLVEPQGTFKYSENEQNPRLDLLRMLRIWHNHRNPDGHSVWNRLDMVLVTSTEPHLLIPPGSSPFNVAMKYEFKPPPFSAEEVAELNRAYGSPLTDTRKLHDLLDGHPGLTQEAFFMARHREYSEDRIHMEAASDADDAPFASHLRYYWLRLSRAPDGRLAAFQRLVCDRMQPPPEHEYALVGAGLVRNVDGRAVVACKLYADYFQKKFRC